MCHIFFLALFIIETWMGNTLFDQISAYNIVLTNKIFIRVVRCSENFQLFMVTVSLVYIFPDITRLRPLKSETLLQIRVKLTIAKGKNISFVVNVCVKFISRNC